MSSVLLVEDGAEVTVSVVRETRPDVLTVPVDALLALREGGYALEMVAEDGSTWLGVDEEIVLLDAAGTEQRRLGHPPESDTPGIGKGMIVGQPSLFQSTAPQQFVISQRKQCHRRHPHRRSVTGIPIVARHLQRTVTHVSPDPFAHRRTDIDRFAAHPVEEVIGDPF